MTAFRGTPAAQGIGIGPIFQYEPGKPKVERAPVNDCDAEFARFMAAVSSVRAALEALRQQVEGSGNGDVAAIFKAQGLMLDDAALLDDTRKIIVEGRANAEWALEQSQEKYSSMLEALPDPYLSARAADLRDICVRVQRVLKGLPIFAVADFDQPSIVVASDLSPADTVQFDRSRLLGFCLAYGGVTSHAAILARAFGIPTVVAMGESILAAAPGIMAIVDGDDGQLLVDPGDEELGAYRARAANLGEKNRIAAAHAGEAAITKDGHRVEVVANIGSLDSAQLAVQSGAEGVGLFRTEFLFLGRETLPSEDEQYEAFRRILSVFGDRPVVLRTLDVGGDKDIPFLKLPKEANPFLGVRGIRLCLERLGLFVPHVRAALRASVGHDLRLMFPMVATASEVREARQLVERCRLELLEEGKAVADRIQLGIMIEVPAAALMAKQLAEEVDFFSIGTNDLSQYTLAADRTNPSVFGLASAFQPAVLKLIDFTIQAAHSAGKWVGLCGEFAGDAVAIPILLGLGLDEFSMAPGLIPAAKQTIRQLDLHEAQDLARRALELDDPAAIIGVVKAHLSGIVG